MYDCSTSPYTMVWALSTFIKAVNFSVTPSSKTSGSKQNTITVDSGYRLFMSHPVGTYISGDSNVRTTDKNLTMSGTTVTIVYYLDNPNNSTANFYFAGTILLIKKLS